MEINFEDVKWPKVLFEDEGDERKDGLHLSDVTRAMMQESGVQKFTGAGFSDMELTAECGLLWERVLSKVMREKYAIRPPQIQKDGIWMSPDGINFPSALSTGPDPMGEYPMVVEEYKFTWKSSKNPPDTNFAYMTQVKAYCHALETPAAVMHIFYCCGDYKGSGPIYRRARIVFTDWELTQNWGMILQHAKRMQEENNNE